MKNRELFTFIRHAVNRASGSDEMIDAALDFLHQLQYDYDTKLLNEESAPEQEEEPAPVPVPEQKEEKKVDLSSSVVIVSCDDSQYIVFGLDVVVAYVDDCFEVVFYDDLDVRDFKYTVFSDSVYFLGGMLYINSDPALFIDSYSAFSSVDKILSKSF